MDDKQTNDSLHNPLFDLPPKKDRVVEPLPQKAASDNPAVNLIRQKISSLYGQEPAAKEEVTEAKTVKHRSKHQEYAYQLSQSGKTPSEIQAAWHDYYQSLSDDEKHEVWQEFYANYQYIKQPFTQTADKIGAPPHQHYTPARPEPKKPSDNRSVADIKNQLLGKIGRYRPKPRSAHAKSLLFGLGMGALVMGFMLFGFFNERFIAPFITPSRNISSTPIIVGTSAKVGPEPKIIIPKINVEIPVVYDEKSIDEKAVQRALEDGALHYPTTPKPGELGNAAIFGHSSNNLLNSGKYKFAFVLLNRLETGDTFMVHYKGTRYVYKVYKKSIVKPEQVEVLNKQEKPATMSLITCDPPGTAINRLVVVGEQISPDPGKNVASSAQPEQAAEPAILPSNAPSLWSRLYDWLTT